MEEKNREQQFKNRQPGRGKRPITIKSLIKKAKKDALSDSNQYKTLLTSYGKKAAQIYSKERKDTIEAIKKEIAIKKLESIVSDDFQLDDINLSRHCIQRFYERPLGKNKVRPKVVLKHEEKMKRKVLSYIKNNATEEQIKYYKTLSVLDHHSFIGGNSFFIPFKKNWLIIVAFDPVTFITIWRKEWREDTQRMQRLEFKMLRSKKIGLYS